MNIDEHFDRVSRQNLKFQFEFEYCAPFWANQCSCGKMLWAVCRCFGIVGAVLNVSGRSQLCGLVSGISP